MKRQLLIAILPLAVLVALPVVLRPARPTVDSATVEHLIIVSPHPEPVRHEFAVAFARYCADKLDRDVRIDWRTPGGTSEIVRYLDDRFQAGFRRYWESHADGGQWSKVVADNFNNRRLDPDDPTADPVARRARRLFLDSDVGIGIDIFFGGGQYDMAKQAAAGHAVDAGIQQLHPEWFTPEAIPQTFSGEIFYDPGGRYYGACLSAFGICWNVDRVAELPGNPEPRRWADLGRPEFRGASIVADPTKSGSINKCFEMLIQQQMAEAVAGAGDAALGRRQGWANGMNLIKQIGANAWRITASASQVPHDVATGNAAVGMCIDFYGRSEAQWADEMSGGRERLVYRTPAGGSSISADPIQLLRGAPNRELAVLFIEFVLSPEGQKLWNYRVGTPGGPVKYALRRLPVRRDLYTPENRQYMADADVDPFKEAAGFEYHGGWTGPYFTLIRVFIHCMVIDPLPELQEAWRAIAAAGGPEAVPDAWAAFQALPFDYDQAGDAAASLDAWAKDQSPLTVLATRREWSKFFADHYRRAAELARAQGGTP